MRVRSIHGRRPVITTAVLAPLAFFAASPVPAGETFAPEGYGEAVGPAQLAEYRAGEAAGTTTATNSFNTTNTANSSQSSDGKSENNSITGVEVSAGDVTVSGEAMSQLRGVSNFVANTAPQSVVQGTVQFTVILNN